MNTARHLPDLRIEGNCKEIKATLLEAPQLKEHCIIENSTINQYGYALKIDDFDKEITSVTINGKPLDVIIEDEIYGIPKKLIGENSTKTIVVNITANVVYAYEIYDEILNKTVSLGFAEVGETVELVNPKNSAKFKQCDAVLINANTESALSKKELSSQKYLFDYVDNLETAYVSFVMPDYPLKINYKYEPIVSKAPRSKPEKRLESPTAQRFTVVGSPKPAKKTKTFDEDTLISLSQLDLDSESLAANDIIFEERPKKDKKAAKKEKDKKKDKKKK